MAPDSGSEKDLGYYYTDWIWTDGSIDLMKSMLLFFDGLTLALPQDLAAQVIERDPVLAAPLAECGLLVNFDPATTLDAAAAEQLARALTACVRQYPNDLLRGPRRTFLTATHWGHFYGQGKQAVDGFERLLSKRGLISPDAQSGLYRMSDEVRFLVLAFFAQALRLQLGAQGIALHLATDEAIMAEGAEQMLNGYLRHLSRAEGRGRGVFSEEWYRRSLSPADMLSPAQLESDLRNVGADLSAVPLDEVLSFRAEHGQQYRAYVKGLRDLLAAQAQAGAIERHRILQERRLEIQSQAADLRRVSRRAFGVRVATLLVSLAGCGWTVHTGDPVGALLATAAAGAQAIPVGGAAVTAYSYLIQAQELGNR
jgi:hypothetical protein